MQIYLHVPIVTIVDRNLLCEPLSESNVYFAPSSYGFPNLAPNLAFPPDLTTNRFSLSRVGGAVQSMAWDSTGERLAIIFTGWWDEVITYDVTITSPTVCSYRGESWT